MVGVAVALDLLEVETLVCSAVNMGSGTVKTEHGILPVPAPATARLLTGAPVYARGPALELTTPTGAAIVKTVADEFGPLPPMTMQTIGFGASDRDLKEQPNVLRLIIGESNGQIGSDAVWVLETNLDDINPEILGHFVEQALAAGALDVFHTPIQMKKNRPGVLLAVLCAESDGDKFTEMILRETSSFGVRRHTAERRKLHREFSSVKTPYGEVTLKLGKLDGKVIQASPEFESCKKLARTEKVPLKAIYESASTALRRQKK